MEPIVGGAIGLILMAGAVAFLIRGVRVSNEHACPAGKWTTVISNFGTGMPATFRALITAADGGEVSGKFREEKFQWIFPGPVKEGPLAADMRFERDWINAIYKVHVMPERDVTVRFE
ncbi:MAG: hypothetical protein FJX76_28925 [Armatimonadetes bacterium]|nr:hypothetical protein [Armatimonadota bacterium]